MGSDITGFGSIPPDVAKQIQDEVEYRDKLIAITSKIEDCAKTLESLRLERGYIYNRLRELGTHYDELADLGKQSTSSVIREQKAAKKYLKTNLVQQRSLLEQ